MPKRLSAAALLLVAGPAWAGANGFVFVSAIPTLDEIGLGALIALVAGVAGWTVRRRARR